MRAREHGATQVKAIARPSNAASREFHLALGMSVEFVPDYFAPGVDRNVFTAPLT